MRLNLSKEWYEREFRKDAEEPTVSAAAGRANLQVTLAEETAMQEDSKHVYETPPHVTALPPSKM